MAVLVQKAKRNIVQVIQSNDVVLVEINIKKGLRVVYRQSMYIAEVKISSETFGHPICKPYPLEISNKDDPVIQMMNCNQY